MHILITGGSGFIGTNLTADILKEGHKVTIYDKQKSETYPDLCIVGDVRDKEKLTKTDYRSLYLKAKGGFFRSIRHLKLYMEEHKMIKK